MWSIFMYTNPLIDSVTSSLNNTESSFVTTVLDKVYEVGKKILSFYNDYRDGTRSLANRVVRSVVKGLTELIYICIFIQSMLFIVKTIRGSIHYFKRYRPNVRQEMDNGGIERNPLQKLRESGIGGMGKQLDRLIKRIFVPRGELKNFCLERGIEPERGIILYGPPGTGKTSLAREIGGLLGCTTENKRLTMRTGSSFYVKWLGESAANVRKLFEPAKTEYIKAKKKGREPRLHVIVIDEIDALLPSRSDSSGEEGVSTSDNGVVTQFLSELDGLQKLSNILVIGITNKLKIIDEAAIRAGRLGFKLEIGLPTKEERKDIFKIKTLELQRVGALGDGIDFNQLAAITEGKTGADIEQYVRLANSFVIDRIETLLETTSITRAELERSAEGKIKMDDFVKAIEDDRTECREEISEEVKAMYI